MESLSTSNRGRAICSALVLIAIFSSFVSGLHLKESELRSETPNPFEWENLGRQLNSVLEMENEETDLLKSLLQRREKDGQTTGAQGSGTTTEQSFPEENSLEINVKGVTAGIVPRLRVPRESSSEGVIQKLFENSKRMESMVIILADLKDVLTQAVTAQEKQMALRTEVVGLREEIDYLRQEIRKMKSDLVAAEGSEGGSPKLANRIHNDEATLGWLKESVKELRHGLVEVSSSVNVTGLLHMKQVWEKEGQRVNKDFQSIQKQIESLAVGQAQNSEAILESKGDVADLRAWQAKMGQKLIQEQTWRETGGMDHTRDNYAKARDAPIPLQRISEKNPLFPLENLNLWTQGENPETDEAASKEEHHPSRHGRRKLRKEMKTMEKMIMEVVHDQSFLHKRLTKLEMSGKTTNANKMSQLDPNEGTKARIFVEDEENQIQDLNPQSLKLKSKRNSRAVENHGAAASFRIASIERSMADYANTLEGIGVQVESLNELRNSNTQLFTALEGLETKYDQRVEGIQSTMAKLEASVSSASVASTECREQQKFQSGQIQGIRKDVVNLKELSHSNSLRVASIQSQMVTWGIKTCVHDSSESIQNIKIAAIEAQLNGEGAERRL